MLIFLTITLFCAPPLYAAAETVGTIVAAVVAGQTFFKTAEKTIPVAWGYTKSALSAARRIVRFCGYCLPRDPYSVFVHRYLNGTAAEAVVAQYMRILNAVYTANNNVRGYLRNPPSDEADSILFETPRAQVLFSILQTGDLEFPTEGALSGALLEGGTTAIKGYLRELLTGYGDVEELLTSLNGAYQAGSLSLDIQTLSDDQDRKYYTFYAYAPLPNAGDEEQAVRQRYMMIKTSMHRPTHGQALFAETPHASDLHPMEGVAAGVRLMAGGAFITNPMETTESFPTPEGEFRLLPRRASIVAAPQPSATHIMALDIPGDGGESNGLPRQTHRLRLPSSGGLDDADLSSSS